MRHYFGITGVFVMMKYSVDIAMMKTARAPDQLYCLGLGSCVGVAVYDPVACVGGLLHVLLPSMREFAAAGHVRTKFADTGIADLVEAVVRSGAVRARLKAKIAGGAAMFAVKNAPESDAIAIGRRNVQSCRNTLRQMGIELIAHDTGGSKGRTVIFDVKTGALIIRMIDRKDKSI